MVADSYFKDVDARRHDGLKGVGLIEGVVKCDIQYPAAQNGCQLNLDCLFFQQVESNVCFVRARAGINFKFFCYFRWCGVIVFKKFNIVHVEIVPVEI